MNSFAIGERIMRTRKIRGFTREVLSEAANITPKFLYSIELGVKGMSQRTLIALCRALNVTADYILLGERPAPLELNIDSILLLQECPEDKIEYLNNMIRVFIDATKS